MVQMGLTEQEFIDFMDSEDETGGVYTKKGLKKMYEHFYNLYSVSMKCDLYAISYCNLYFLVVILNPP
jgi:hypothetical protein